MSDKANLKNGFKADDDIRNLLSTLDTVTVSPELKSSTIDHILNKTSDSTNLGAISAETPRDNVISIRKRGRSALRVRTRKFGLVAIAACLAFGIMGGAAYATPISYYEFEQDNEMITLGMNCFGKAITIKADGENSRTAIEDLDFRNKPRDEAVEAVLNSMGQKDPEHPIEYGPRDGEHIRIEPPETNVENSMPTDVTAPNDGLQPAAPNNPKPESADGAASQPLESGGNGSQKDEPSMIGEMRMCTDTRETEPKEQLMPIDNKKTRILPITKRTRYNRSVSRQ